MQITISPLAERDLEEIGDYIALDNPIRAITFIEELFIQCQKIAEYPEAYPKRSEVYSNIRICSYRRYLIIFTIQCSSVRIERILHSARNINFLLN